VLLPQAREQQISPFKVPTDHQQGARHVLSPAISSWRFVFMEMPYTDWYKESGRIFSNRTDGEVLCSYTHLALDEAFQARQTPEQVAAAAYRVWLHEKRKPRITP
jgi:hypothetical protein